MVTITIIIVIALALFAYSVLLVARAAGAPSARSADRLARIDAYGFAGDSASASAPERQSIVPALGAGVAQRVGSDQLAAIRSRLLAAGMYGTSAETFLGYRLLSMVLVPLLTVWAAASSSFPPAMMVVLVVLGLWMGWTLPVSVVARRGRRRLEQIDRGMPELVDLLVVSVESGMGFAGALRLSSARMQGPLADELKLMLREQSLGASTSEALVHMLGRCDTAATRSFVRTINQGERLGVSIGQMMRSLAEEMRKRRKANAEERAHKAPIKIVFPLVFLIFPAMFIVLLGPAVLKIVDGFG